MTLLIHRQFFYAAATLILANFASCAPTPTKALPLRAVEYPAGSLSNGSLTLRFYLPDPSDGYYRGSRFDWSGIVSRLQYQSHSCFAPFKSTHNPLNHDDVLGTAEEFGMESPLGYNDAKPGETFIKIGVGELRRIEEPTYRFYQNYEVVRPFPWHICQGPTWIEFTQQSPQVHGYAYLYIKRLSLLQDHTGFRIRRTLRNTGVKHIDTDHYGHNFVILDDHPIGPNYEISYPFTLSTKTAETLAAPAVINGNTIGFTGAVAENKPVWVQLSGHSDTRENTVTVSHVPSRVSLQIRQDFISAHMILYAKPTAICPEAFIHLKLSPGQEKTWQTDYILNVPESNDR